MAARFTQSPDYLFSIQMHETFAAPFYEKYAYSGKYIALGTDGCSGSIQCELNVDTIMQSSPSETLYVEEKYERRHSLYQTFALETVSNPNENEDNDPNGCSYTTLTTWISISQILNDGFGFGYLEVEALDGGNA